MSFGVSYGGGQTVRIYLPLLYIVLKNNNEIKHPQKLKNKPSNYQAFEIFKEDEYIKRIVQHAMSK